MSYLDFVVQIIPGPKGNPMVHVRSERGEGSAPFQLPFDDSTWRHVDLSEAIAGGRHLVPQEEEGARGDRREIGEQLFEALFSGEVLRLYERCLDRIESQPDLGLRISLMIDPREPQVASLQALPWELMRQPDTPNYLALRRRQSLVRHLAFPHPVDTRPWPQFLRILCVRSNPGNQVFLNLQGEIDALGKALAGIGEVIEPETPTLDGVRKALLEHECHVLHFMGHGELMEDATKGILWFESVLVPDAGERIRGEDLANKLADIPSLRLVVLNACESARTGPASLLAGVASALVLGGLPAVVAMQARVSDGAALAFSRVFYQRLAASDSLDAAVTEGRQAIHSMDPSSFEWATPVVFMRVQDGYLPTRVPPQAPERQMAVRRWYQGPNVAVAVIVLLIGLVGTVVTVMIGKGGFGEKPETPIQSGPNRRPTSYTVRVQILNPQGQPVTGSTIRTSVANEKKRTAEGWWEVEIPAAKVPAGGQITLWAEHPDWGGSSKVLRLGTESNVPVEIRLKEPESWLRGQVVDESRRGLAGVRVSLQSGQKVETRTDAAGHFALKLAVPAETSIRVLAERNGWAPADQHCLAGRDTCSLLLEKP